LVTTRGLAVVAFWAGVVAAAESRGIRAFLKAGAAGATGSTDSLRLRGMAAGVAASTDSLRIGGMIKDVARIWEEVGRMNKRKGMVIGTVAIEIFAQITRTNPSSDHLRFYSVLVISPPLFGFYDSL